MTTRRMLAGLAPAPSDVEPERPPTSAVRKAVRRPLARAVRKGKATLTAEHKANLLRVREELLQGGRSIRALARTLDVAPHTLASYLKDLELLGCKLQKTKGPAARSGPRPMLYSVLGQSLPKVLR